MTEYIIQGKKENKEPFSQVVTTDGIWNAYYKAKQLYPNCTGLAVMPKIQN